MATAQTGDKFLGDAFREDAQAEDAQAEDAQTKDAQGAAETVVIPLAEESLAVDKRAVITGGVRVTKHVTERDEVIDQPLLRESVSVERVPIGQIVAEAPPARQEGDTLIIPLLEEVLVTEKRLLLKEELRITRTQATVREPQTVTLRTERATVEEIIPEQTLDTLTEKTNV